MLNFKQSVEDVYAHIRAFFPWAKTYFAHKNKFFIPNPYCVEILENDTDEKTVGKIVDKSAKDKSITVICGDGKLLKMSHLRLYGWHNRFFTKFYIKHFVKKNDIAE